MLDYSPPAPRPLRGILLALLCLIYIVAGLAGHAPWKGDDAVNFGVAFSIIDGNGWLLPHLAGELWLDSPPLYHWLAALVGIGAKAWLPLPDAVRLTSGFFAALFLLSLAGAGRSLHGRDGGAAAALIAVGCLGLLVPLHETQPAVAVLAAGACVYWGLAVLPRQPVRGGLLLGGGIGVAFLVAGLDALAGLVPIAAISLIGPAWRTRTSALGFVVGLLLALPLIALWPALLAWRAPAALGLWWGKELASLHPSGTSSAAEYAELLGWLAWPALPLALWAIWRHRRRLNQAAVALPLAGTLLGIVLFVTLHEARPMYALPLLVPLILLATAGAGELRRGAANAFDWFGMMTFTLVAFLVWLGGIAMVFGVPAQIQHNFEKLEPGFKAHLAPFPWAVAAVLTGAWLWYLFRAPRSPWRAVAHWAAGVTLMWVLIAALWFPWIDYGKSYRGVALGLKEAVGGRCVAGSDLNDALRASLHYFAGIVPVPPDSAAGRRCPRLLIQETGDGETRPEGWQPVWEGHRPGDRNERLRLYARAAATR